MVGGPGILCVEMIRGLKSTSTDFLFGIKGLRHPFYELFQRYHGDFYKIDPSLFSPAEVSLNNVVSGRSYHAGRVNLDIIRQMLAE